jgi:hypothetical protein
MPMVGKKKFPYTAKGKKDAKMEEEMTGKKMVKRVSKPAKKKSTMVRKKAM